MKSSDSIKSTTPDALKTLGGITLTFLGFVSVACALGVATRCSASRESPAPDNAPKRPAASASPTPGHAHQSPHAPKKTGPVQTAGSYDLASGVYGFAATLLADSAPKSPFKSGDDRLVWLSGPKAVRREKELVEKAAANIGGETAVGACIAWTTVAESASEDSKRIAEELLSVKENNPLKHDGITLYPLGAANSATNGCAAIVIEYAGNHPTFSFPFPSQG